MNHHRWRITLPIVLIGLGVWLLHGCIYIPTFNAVQEGENVTKKIGNQKSRKPLRVGVANRADVERVLGPPRAISQDGREIAYAWHVLEGIWVMPLCFMAEDQRGVRAAILTFDDAGVLRSFRVVKQSDSLTANANIDLLLLRGGFTPRQLWSPTPAATGAAPPHSATTADPSQRPPPPGPRYVTPPSP